MLLFPFAIAILYYYPQKTYACVTSTFWGAFCLSVSLLGLLVRAITVGHTPKGTSGRNTDKQIAECLNCTGIYSVVRHPLYLGNFLMWLGLFLFIGIWWFTLVCVLAYWLYYERIMFAEEEFLRRNYTITFEQWASRTPAIIPRFSGWQASNLPFSLRTVLKREYNGLFATMLSFTILNACSYLINQNTFKIDNFWQVAFIIGTSIFLILRSLKKYTTVLEIAGR